MRWIAVSLLLGLACRPEVAQVAEAPAQASVAPAQARPTAAGEAEPLPGLQARFPELRAYAPVPTLTPPTWLRQGTLWLADGPTCRPIWRIDIEDVRRRELVFCAIEAGDDAAKCRQPIEVDGTLHVLPHHGCSLGMSARAIARERAAAPIGKGGGGGFGVTARYPAEPLGSRPPVRGVRARGSVWAPVAVAEEHVVFAATWRFALRTSAVRVEEACTPGSVARARELVARDESGAQAELLRRRFGIEGEVRRCVFVEDERLERSEMPDALAFAPRTRNVRTQDEVDCAAPCPADPEDERRDLAATAFVATESPTLVLYRDRKGCEAGALRSTLVMSDAPCREMLRRRDL